ncbi:MAG: hypothetical protein AAFX93_11145 [Verrucomicrobiota bacterium]
MANPFSNRPAKTVLVDTGHGYFRVDLGQKAGRFQVLRVITNGDSSESARSDDFFEDALAVDDGAWITALLQLKPKPAAAVKVLSAKVAAAVMEMPYLSGESEGESVSMELESLTGLSTVESQWTWKRLPSEEGLLRAWAIQASFEQLMAWRNVVGSVRGCHLAAVCHPGGIQLGTVSQLELWPGLALYQQTDTNARNLQGWSGEGSSISAVADVSVGDSISRGNLLLLLPNGEIPAEASDCATIRLDEEAGRLKWAEHLAEALDPLSKSLEALPRLVIPKPEMSNRELALVTAGVTGAAVLLAVAHFAFVKTSSKNLEQQVASMRLPVEEVRDGEKKINDLKRELRRLQGKRSDEPFDVSAHRSRMASLLHLLAHAVNEEVVMQGIESRGLDIMVSGVSASSQGPANYVRSLNQFVTDTGWRATLAGRDATLVFPDGGPWTFTVELSPANDSLASAQANQGRTQP